MSIKNYGVDYDMKSYIFFTNEGTTYQPDLESNEPDIENCQIIGWAQGCSAKVAFDNLKDDNMYLLNSNFEEIKCQQLASESVDYFTLV